MNDISAMIEELLGQRERLGTAIDALRGLQSAANETRAARAGTERKRGRKTMSAAERREVSARMKRYWAKRRKQAA